MNLSNQLTALNQLRDLANHNRHSILISGPRGSGKTYLSRCYAEMLDVHDFVEISSTVQDIRGTFEELNRLGVLTLACVENLDDGVAAASASLLKILEEPSPNLYVVVTCKNINNVPDTIVSRSVVVDVGHPTHSDISDYAEYINFEKYDKIQTEYPELLRCMTSYTDVNKLLNMDVSELQYFRDLEPVFKFKDSISNIVWKLSHYESGQECDVLFTLKYILNKYSKDLRISRACISAMSDIESSRFGTNAVLTKFAFECKYGE